VFNAELETGKAWAYKEMLRDIWNHLVARRSLADADDGFWADVMSLNLDSLHRVTRAAAPHLVAAAETGGGASIVNLSSLAGRKGGHPGSLAYSAAKGAILAFTRALATELGPAGVRVNALAPGLILGTSFHATHTTPESARATIEGIPLGRAGTPEDVARAAVFLASEYDGFISGATIDINGGIYGC
jgi:3-oxoacyl-[acyl-carrier protein] reductase